MKEYLVDRKGMKNLTEMDQVFERKYLHVCHRPFYQIYHVFTCTETTEWHTVYISINCEVQYNLPYSIL